MKKTAVKESTLRTTTLLLASLQFLFVCATTASAQDDLRAAQALVRNLTCLAAWLAPLALAFFSLAGGLLVLSGDAGNRLAGKRLIINAVKAFLALLVLSAVISFTLPDVNPGICFGSIPFLGNEQPIAEARVGFDQRSAVEKSVEITLGDAAHFDGSQSWDPDGTVASYLWDYGDGTYGIDARTEHTYGKGGRYYAKLYVKDDKGAACGMSSMARVLVNPPTTPSGRVIPRVPDYSTTTSTLAIAPTTLYVDTTTTTTTTTYVQLTLPPKLTLLFVPLGWQSGLPAFNAAADQQANFLISNVPLRSCPARVKVLKLPEICPYSIPLSESGCDGQADDMLSAIYACAQSMGQPYDYAIGLNDRDVCGSIGGFSAHVGVVFAESYALMVTAHELGHEFGLVDEYVDACRCMGRSGPNCLDASLGGSDPAGGYSAAYCAGGSRCAGYTLTCSGNKNALNGRCIMSYMNAPAPRAFCQHCWNHFLRLSFLNC